jgi:hypothetical protein
LKLIGPYLEKEEEDNDYYDDDLRMLMAVETLGVILR